MLVDAEDTSQLIGETAGGFFEPRRLFFTYFPKVLRKGKSLVGMGGLDQREIRIGEQFRRLIEAYGDDPDALITEIEANPARLDELIRDLNLDIDGDDITLTPAQITGSPILGAFQRTFAGKGILGKEAERRAETGYNALALMSETLIASGDQAMVQLGIQIQRDAIADMLSGRMIASMANQTAAYERLGKDVDYTQVGTALRLNLEQIYTDGRNQEDASLGGR